MKVKKLIRELQKLPKNLEIYRADEDHGNFETLGIVNTAELIDKSEMKQIIKTLLTIILIGVIAITISVVFNV